MKHGFEIEPIDVEEIEARARKLRADTFAHGAKEARNWVMGAFARRNRRTA